MFLSTPNESPELNSRLNVNNTPRSSEISSKGRNCSSANSPPGAAAGSSAGIHEARRHLEDVDHQDAFDRMEESARQASWGGANTALHGLLRKLGAGLDDLLPSVSGSHSRLKNILSGMKADDDGRQLAALSELCELISIGSEEAISALSVDTFVPLLVQQLRKEHNADIMLLASRAMCHMMDALPSSPAAIVHYDAVPLFCARLLSIEYIDLAEQALQALEKLSHEHPLAILRAGGMLAVLQYVDFFATGVQRISVSTAANLCRGLPVECGHLVADAVPLLTNLLHHQDQKVLENVCLAFARLVEAFAHSPQKLEMVASHGLLPNLLQLISTMVAGSSFSDISLSDSTYTMLLRTMALLCRGSASLCKQLLELQVSTKLREILLTDESLASGVGASISRPNDQLHQILSLADELLPALPWAATLPFSSSRSHAPKRRVKRGVEDDDEAVVQSSTEREKALAENPQLLDEYTNNLFATLLHVYNCAANLAVRTKCLSCITKVLHFYPRDSLSELLRELPFASFVSSLLSSQEPPAAIAALYMADILLSKLPNIYMDKFLREGVFHAADALCNGNAEAADSKSPKIQKRTTRSSSEADILHTSPIGSGTSTSTPFLSDSRKSTSLRQSSSSGVACAPSPAATSPAVRSSSRFASQGDGGALLVARAVQFREAFISNNAQLSCAIANGEGSGMLQKLRTLASTICDDFCHSTLNPKVELVGDLLSFSDVAALQQLAALLADRDGISTFELANSGLVDAVLRYLTTEQAGDEAKQGPGSPSCVRRNFRLRAFCHLFLGLPAPPLPPSSSPLGAKKGTPSASTSPMPNQATGSSPSVPGREVTLLQVFVEKLQDALNMTERFPLVLSDSSSSDSSGGLRSLTQPFKLRLQRAPGQSIALKDYANNVVLIEPLATAAAIEDFLWPKVRRDAIARQALRDASSTAPAPATAPAASLTTDSPATAEVVESTTATRSGAGAGKLPVRSDTPATMDTGSSPPASKMTQGKERHQQEFGVFLETFESAKREAMMRDTGEEVDDDDDDDDACGEDEDEDEGSVLGSPALASSLDAECVHDLQLNSPDRPSGAGTTKSLPAFTLPPRDAASHARSAESNPSAAGAASSSHGAHLSHAAPIASGSSTAANAMPQALPRSDSGAVDNANEQSGGRSSGTTSTDADGRAHNLMLVLNGHVLPFGMTIFQAIRQYGSAPHGDTETELSSSAPIGQRLWGDVHTISYQLITPEDLPRLSENEAVSSELSGTSLGHNAALSHVSGRQVSVMAHNANPIEAQLKSSLPNALHELGHAGTLLHLLWLLEILSTHWRSLYDEFPPAFESKRTVLPASSFLNRKLNAKLTRQLQDPLALCSRSLPPWCASLTASCSFLFSFESRRLYLHSTAFGLSRALQRLQQHSHNASTSTSERSEFRLGRLPRQKVRISRARVMDSALKVMDLYASHKAMLEVEYFGEVGTGLGPTLEFYTLVSRELCRQELHLWVGEAPPEAAGKSSGDEKEDDDGQQYVYTPFGLFPKAVQQDGGTSGVPTRVLQLFTFMGRFVAKAMLDNRLVDLPLSAPFLRSILGLQLSMSDLAEINPQLAKTLLRLQALANQRQAIIDSGAKQADIEAATEALTLDGSAIVDLGLDFTLPGQPEVELVSNGSECIVTIENVGEYVQRVLEVYLLEGVRAQINAFCKGFSDVFPIEHLRAFSANELDLLFNGTREKWERDTIVEHLKFDHGYTRSSRAIGFLLEILCDLDDATLSQFLKFVTGSPRLPVGGLARLSPRLTIVLKRPENGVSPDAYLPSVMTCANYLKLPDYSTKDIMRERLMTSIFEGQGAFLLS